MRLDNDGGWSHKPGTADVTDKAWWAFEINDPESELKNRGYTELVGSYYIVPQEQ